MKIIRWAVWLLDESLDQVPRREDGHWYRYGLWGCQLRLWKFWWRAGLPPAYFRRTDEDGWFANPTLDRIGN